jgi:hypothetical protein
MYLGLYTLSTCYLFLILRKLEGFLTDFGKKPQTPNLMKIVAVGADIFKLNVFFISQNYTATNQTCGKYVTRNRCYKCKIVVRTRKFVIKNNTELSASNKATLAPGTKITKCGWKPES